MINGREGLVLKKEACNVSGLNYLLNPFLMPLHSIESQLQDHLQLTLSQSRIHPGAHTISSSAPPLHGSCPFFGELGASSTYQTFQSGCLSAVLTLDKHLPVVRVPWRGLSLRRIHSAFPQAFRSP